MNNKTLYILRSVSGAGKTTLAKALEKSLDNCKAISADDFWCLEDPDIYNFDINLLGEAHKECKCQCERLMKNMYKNIICGG
jgi:gluconate kinase